MKSILIVDYDRSNLRVFKRMFLLRGFVVDTARDGEEAKRKILGRVYDAALISFVLPDMGGIELLLFTARSLPGAAKIITTGFPSLADGVRVFEAGADAYFSKPVKPEELIRVVEEKLKLAVKRRGVSGSVGSSGSGRSRQGLLN